jgi:class 3 adenylate cyclase
MSSTFVETERLIVLIDLAGFAKTFQSRTDLDVATWVQGFYEVCDRVLTGHGGTLIKFMGDACLTTFAPEKAASAVAAVRELQVAVDAHAREGKMPVSLGANLHIGTIIEGEFGGAARRGRDIIGRGVNQTFLLGSGSGVRISEPVYRALPSDARSPWRKHKPPAIYHLDVAAGLLEGGGKSAGQNTARW